MEYITRKIHENNFISSSFLYNWSFFLLLLLFLPFVSFSILFHSHNLYFLLLNISLIFTFLSLSFFYFIIFYLYNFSVYQYFIVFLYFPLFLLLTFSLFVFNYFPSSPLTNFVSSSPTSPNKNWRLCKVKKVTYMKYNI